MKKIIKRMRKIVYNSLILFKISAIAYEMQKCLKFIKFSNKKKKKNNDNFQTPFKLLKAAHMSIFLQPSSSLDYSIYNNLINLLTSQKLKDYSCLDKDTSLLLSQPLKLFNPPTSLLLPPPSLPPSSSSHLPPSNYHSSSPPYHPPPSSYHPPPPSSSSPFSAQEMAMIVNNLLKERNMLVELLEKTNKERKVRWDKGYKTRKEKYKEGEGKLKEGRRKKEVLGRRG